MLHLVSLGPPYLGPLFIRLPTIEFAYDWLSEIARILKVHMDYSEEIHHDVLVRNTTIQLCLCIQNSLGFKGEFIPRTF